MDDDQIKALLAQSAAKTSELIQTALGSRQAADDKDKERQAKDAAKQKAASDKDAAARLAAKQSDAAKSSHAKADEKVTAMQAKIAQATQGDLKAKAMAAGLIDTDFLSLSVFDLPDGTMPGDDAIQAKVDEVKKAKGGLFKAPYSGNGKQPPGPGQAASTKGDIPDEWNLYGKGIDLRAGLRDEDGTVAFDMGPISAQAVKLGVDLREASAKAPSSSIF